MELRALLSKKAGDQFIVNGRFECTLEAKPGFCVFTDFSEDPNAHDVLNSTGRAKVCDLQTKRTFVGMVLFQTHRDLEMDSAMLYLKPNEKTSDWTTSYTIVEIN